MLFTYTRYFSLDHWKTERDVSFVYFFLKKKIICVYKFRNGKCFCPPQTENSNQSVTQKTADVRELFAKKTDSLNMFAKTRGCNSSASRKATIENSLYK